jgi:hypothetical protein
MAATAVHRLTLDPIGKCSNAFSETKNICSGGHLGFPIGVKNLNFVEDLPVIISGQFGFNCPSGLTTNMIKAKLYMNVHWMVFYKL